ncbi:FAD binding domain-containing protein [Podospora aff. communis PSN243]|uniref:Fumarate reductase n=1 Tax=Podospora aff. communis PSN243 TaxID=3040156 RepID=A0AAV9GXK8_9PEZI|nr:FAD binding domain-containing protein [Podospora aff. communis PSN243]
MIRTRSAVLVTILISLAAVMYNNNNRHNTHTADADPLPVIIVGSGLAGLSAAYNALQSGAPSVYLLERAAKPGGNSFKASSGINGALKGDDAFYTDTVRSAGKRLAETASSATKAQREHLIKVLTERSPQAIEFLEGLGVDLSVVTQLGGHSRARTHRGAGKTPPGVAIVSALLDKCKTEFGEERFRLVTGCEVKGLLKAEDGVMGVQYTTNGGGEEVLKGPVVFATGGFAGDTHGLLARYRPDLSGLPSTNEPRPAGHDVLTAVGARLVDMDSVQIHPTGFVDPQNPGARLKFLAAEMLRGEGGILLHEGKRFVNELETRERVSDAIMKLPEAKEEGGLKQWDMKLLLDPGAAKAAEGHVSFYVWKGLLKRVKAKDLDETTQKTLRDYAEVVSGRGGKVDELGRKAFGHWSLGVKEWDDGAEVCVGRITPIVHFTMGGVVINDHAQVLASELGQEQKPIQGLWAAGEITGGIHGDNRLGGSSLLECVVFGRIAGGQAALAARGGRV